MSFTVSRALHKCALAFINLAEAFEKHPDPAQPPHLDADALRSVKPKLGSRSGEAVRPTWDMMSLICTTPTRATLAPCA